MLSMSKRNEMACQALAVCVGLGTMIGTAVSFATQDVHMNGDGVSNPFLFDDGNLLMLMMMGAPALFFAGAYALNKNSKPDYNFNNMNESHGQERVTVGLLIAGLGKMMGVLMICTTACIALAAGFTGESTRPDYAGPSGTLDKTLFGFMYGGLALLSAISAAPEIKKVVCAGSSPH